MQPLHIPTYLDSTNCVWHTIQRRLALRVYGSRILSLGEIMTCCRTNFMASALFWPPSNAYSSENRGTLTRTDLQRRWPLQRVSRTFSCSWKFFLPNPAFYATHRQNVASTSWDSMSKCVSWSFRPQNAIPRQFHTFETARQTAALTFLSSFARDFLTSWLVEEYYATPLTFSFLYCTTYAIPGWLPKVQTFLALSSLNAPSLLEMSYITLGKALRDWQEVLLGCFTAYTSRWGRATAPSQRKTQASRSLCLKFLILQSRRTLHTSLAKRQCTSSSSTPG